MEDENVTNFSMKQINNGVNVLPYRLSLPEGYDENKKYPLFLFLHGAGERGNDNLLHLSVNTPFGVLMNEENRVKFPCIAVAPQCPENHQWVNTDWSMGSYRQAEIPISIHLSMVADLLDQLVKEYPIDESRIYIIGISMGGYGTWDLIVRYPNRFAAAIPIAGGGDPNLAQRIKDIPIWAFHGDIDTVVPPSSSRDMVTALNNVSANISYTEFQGVEHNSWSPAYNEPTLFSWLFSQKK